MIALTLSTTALCRSVLDNDMSYFWLLEIRITSKLRETEAMLLPRRWASSLQSMGFLEPSEMILHIDIMRGFSNLWSQKEIYSWMNH